MAQVTFTQEVRHDRDLYEAGSTVDIPDAIAGYFVGNGWAVPGDAIPAEGDMNSNTSPVFPDGAPQEVTLEIQDVNHEQEVNQPNG